MRICGKIVVPRLISYAQAASERKETSFPLKFNLSHKLQLLNMQYNLCRHTDLYPNDGVGIYPIFWIYIIGRLNIHLQGPSCEEVGNRTSQPPTTLQYHVLA